MIIVRKLCAGEQNYAFNIHPTKACWTFVYPITANVIKLTAYLRL